MLVDIVAVESDEEVILHNLIEKYEYELTQYFDHDVNELGLYGFDYFDSFFHENAKRWVFFIKVDGKLAGFAMILADYFYLKSRKADYTLADFFVMHKYRGRGVGTFAARYLFAKFKGVWQLNTFDKNTAAVGFWLKVIRDYTEGAYEILPNEEPEEEFGPGDEKWRHKVFLFSSTQ
jgi:Predicted acetyltransferase